MKSCLRQLFPVAIGISACQKVMGKENLHCQPLPIAQIFDIFLKQHIENKPFVLEGQKAFFCKDRKHLRGECLISIFFHSFCLVQRIIDFHFLKCVKWRWLGWRRMSGTHESPAWFLLEEDGFYPTQGETSVLKPFMIDSKKGLFFFF